MSTRDLLTLLVLGSLQAEDLYAYELKKRVTSCFGAVLRVSDGTLYPLLRSLEEAGALEAHAEPGEPGRPERVVYRITPAGRDLYAERVSAPLSCGVHAPLDFASRVICFSAISVEASLRLIGEREAQIARELAGLEAAGARFAAEPGHARVADLRRRQLAEEIAWLSELRAAESGRSSESARREEARL